jgi:hypothetical protein
MAAASASTNGYLTSTDWSTFNNKGSGTVTSVAASVPSFLSIAGSPITTSGTLAIGLSGTALPTTSGGTGLTSFTANGVVYASSTSALATGSAFVFDGANVSITGTGSSNTGILKINATDVASTFVWASQSFISGMTAGQHLIHMIGRSGSPYNAGYIGYKYSSLGSTSNVLTFGHYASDDLMTLDGSGIVTMRAYGAGAATFSAAGVISSVSDETWKIKDGIPADPDAMLKKLQPGYWYYNDEKKKIFGTQRELGFYAQNVNAAIGPEAAPEPEEGKPWGYYDRSVLAVAVMSLQKALDTIDSLTARIAALEQK